MSDIMSVSRLRLGSDGDGIRTLVGFHGCPLNCRYCANRHCHNLDISRADFTADELVDILSLDEPYFFMTGGGVTFGGGEPLLQADFIHEVCRKIDKRWHCIIETSLYVEWEQIKVVAEDIDFWFVDIKDTNDEIYEAYTGQSNHKVLSNLKNLVDLVGADKICVRLPLIPGFNTEKDREKSMDYVMTQIDARLMLDVFDYIRC